MARSVAMQSAQDNPHIQEALRQRQERQDRGSLCDDSELDLSPDELVLQILTPEQEAEIRSAWAQFDTNGDGELCVPCCAARARVARSLAIDNARPRLHAAAASQTGRCLTPLRAAQ